jgi:hypothetical protein
MSASDKSSSQQKRLSPGMMNILSLVGAASISGLPADLVSFPFSRLKTMQMTKTADVTSPQFKGMTKEKRRKMAVAAKLTAERGGLKLGEQMVDEPVASDSDPAIDKNKQNLDKQKIANMKMLQQKQQTLQRQRLQMQKSGKLPLDVN